MTEATVTLAEFLLARIAEDEAVAREELAHWPEPWRSNPPREVHTSSGSTSDAVIVGPGRWLAECAAKRRVIDMLPGYTIECVLEELAAIYADHPDYREEWRA